MQYVHKTGPRTKFVPVSSRCFYISMTTMIYKRIYTGPIDFPQSRILYHDLWEQLHLGADVHSLNHGAIYFLSCCHSPWILAIYMPYTHMDLWAGWT